VERLDEERIEVLRQWGEGLARDDREEMRAAGRAIMLLIEEIDRLHVDLWSVRTAIPLETRDTSDEERDVQISLRARLKQFGRRRGEASEMVPPETTST
jgi:hypothetical protein